MSTAQSPKGSKGVVAIYATHDRAEHAIHELDNAGGDMKSMSIIGRDYHTEAHVVGYYQAGDRMQYWGKQEAFWGGMWRQLSGSAFFSIPGAGPFVVAGPLVAWIIGGLEGAVVKGGRTAIGAGLISMGITRDSVLENESALGAGKIIVMFHGTAAESIWARDILNNEGAESCFEHDLLPAPEGHAPLVTV